MIIMKVLISIAIGDNCKNIIETQHATTSFAAEHILEKKGLLKSFLESK